MTFSQGWCLQVYCFVSRMYLPSNYFFTLFILMLVGVMHWELGKMLTPISLQAMWFSSIISMFVTFFLLISNSSFWSITFIIIHLGLQRVFFHHNRDFGALYSLAVVVCGVIFYNVRIDFGLFHTVWLIGIVVVTDTAGYIIGRTVGGPKVFPRIAQKTWSGVLAGWLAVGIFSWYFVGNVALKFVFTFVSISVLLSALPK